MPSKIILIDSRTLANALGVHTDTICRYVRRGQLPPYDVNITTRARRWQLDTLKKFPKISASVIEYLKKNPAPPL